MLGMVFTELIEMVETEFSVQMAEAMVQDVAPPHGGAYTAVGYFDHQELMALVAALSRRSGIEVDALVQLFGKHLMGRFAERYPALLSRHHDLFDFLASVDSSIHVEVRKLYPQASLPRFDLVSRSEELLVMNYRSPRHLVSLALGLIDGASAHYREPCLVWSEAVPGSADVRLHVQKHLTP